MHRVRDKQLEGLGLGALTGTSCPSAARRAVVATAAFAGNSDMPDLLRVKTRACTEAIASYVDGNAPTSASLLG